MTTSRRAELSPGAWSRAADPERRVGHAVEFHPTIGSTSDRAHAVLREPGGEGRAIVADLQTQGRGRRGRSWLSPAASNLMVSVGIRCRLSSRDAWWIGAAAALAVSSAAASTTAAPFLIRWPNDVVTGEGHKVAGLLIETALDGVWLRETVIGIGLNVNWSRAAMPPEIAERASSLCDVRGATLDRVEVLGALLRALDDEIGRCERGESPLPRYRERQWLDGRLVRIEAGDRILEGTASGIGPEGGLLLRTHDGLQEVGIGEVVRVAERSWIP